MPVTIKKIAEISGVSRGTVDRVLNNRGRVNDKTAQKVRKCADMLGYKPNALAKALVTRRKELKIAVVLNSIGNEFFDDIISEIERLSIEYKNYSVITEIIKLKGYDVSEQFQALEKLEDINGLILTPVNDEKIVKKINEFHNNNIPVITLNTDILNSNRLCYVGSDYYSGGKIAAGIAKIIRKKGAIVGIVNGSKNMYGHNVRVKGFCDELSSDYEVAFICEGEDDDKIAYEQTSKMLKEHKNINLIFTATAGVTGVNKATQEAQSKIDLITFDETPAVINLIKKGVIKATVTQQPRQQASVAMNLMFNLLFIEQMPDKQNYIVENLIKIKQNY